MILEDGEPPVMDGPFTETKELLAGLALVWTATPATARMPVERRDPGAPPGRGSVVRLHRAPTSRQPGRRRGALTP